MIFLLYQIKTNKSFVTKIMQLKKNPDLGSDRRIAPSVSLTLSIDSGKLDNLLATRDSQ